MSAGVSVFRTSVGPGAGPEIVHVTLDRPEHDNAFTVELLETLVARLEALEREPPPLAVVLSGAGGTFSSGADLVGLQTALRAGNGRDWAVAFLGALNAAIMAFVSLRCPLIVRVEGQAGAEALGFVLAAELVVMDRAAALHARHAAIGLAPGGGWTAMLPARIGTARALEAVMLDRPIPAAEALRLGLATAVAEGESSGRIVERWIGALSTRNGAALRHARALVWSEARRRDLAASLEAERRAFVDVVDTPDVRASLEAHVARLQSRGRPVGG